MKDIRHDLITGSCDHERCCDSEDFSGKSTRIMQLSIPVTNMQQGECWANIGPDFVRYLPIPRIHATSRHSKILWHPFVSTHQRPHYKFHHLNSLSSHLNSASPIPKPRSVDHWSPTHHLVASRLMTRPRLNDNATTITNTCPQPLLSPLSSQPSSSP
jgi:hypothetical protein